MAGPATGSIGVPANDRLLNPVMGVERAASDLGGREILDIRVVQPRPERFGHRDQEQMWLARATARCLSRFSR